MTDFLLDADGVCRDFPTPAGTVHVLRDVTLHVPRTRLTMLRGPSGSGKTTLLNLLGALDTPTSGRITLDGEEISTASDAKRDRTRRQIPAPRFSITSTCDCALMAVVTPAAPTFVMPTEALISWRQKPTRPCSAP